MPHGTVLLWGAFAVVHAALAWLGVVVVPAEAFHDVDLYRYWMYLALEEGRWPVLDEPWVYPVGAVVPMLVPALGTTVSTPGYALGWCALVTGLNGVAFGLLLRRSGPVAPSRWGAGWWLAFTALLGPVAMGRLDGVVAPLMVIALAAAARSARGTAFAAALLTFGAWVKVAPGALVLAVATAARRPFRDVVLPAGAVCASVVAVVAAGGGLERVTGFLATQQERGLQVESVAATPWVLASLTREDVRIGLNDALITYEVAGPGTREMAGALDLVLVVLVAGVTAALLAARRRGTAGAVLLPAALTLLLVLVVANKVGSPQFMTWVAPPIAVALARRHHHRGWMLAAGLGLLCAGLTQIVFPWGYLDLLAGSVGVTVVLALRNVLLVALLAVAMTGLVQAVRQRPDGASVSPREGRPPGRPAPGGPGRRGRAPGGRPG